MFWMHETVVIMKCVRQTLWTVSYNFACSIAPWT
jgi:hypothetical protein